MSEVAAAQSASICWIQQASSNPLEFQKSLEEVLENFGPEETGNASAKQFLGAFITALREQINNSDLPQSVKDMANATLDAFEATLDDSCPCSSEASEAVANCSQSGAINQSAEATAEAAAEAANEGTSTTACCSTTTSAHGSSGAETQAASEVPTQGSGGHDSLDELNSEQATQAGTKEERKGTWLEVLAGDLSGIQSHFLDKAMESKDNMLKEVDNADPVKGKSKAFLDAQSLYTAQIQLFTIFSNQSSTSIKSIGEALAGIARKQ